MFGHHVKRSDKANDVHESGEEDKNGQTMRTTKNDGEASRNDRPNQPFGCFQLLNSIPLSLLALLRSLKQSGHFISQFEFNLFIILFIVSRCSCLRYYLPAHYDFRMCSTGFRISVYSVESFNSSSGFTLYFTDHAELEHYKLNISFLNHNHLPNFSSDKPERISRNEMRTVPNKTVLSVRRPSELHDYQNMDLFFKEYFYFTKTSDGQKYRVSGYSTELIGCPQVLCLNSYLDATFYHEKEGRFYFFRGAYYYYISKLGDGPFEPKFNLIGTKFFGVPMHIDAAAYYKTDFYSSSYVIVFSKEDTVYVYSEHRGTGVAVPQLQFFNDPNGNPVRQYIDSISDMANGNLMISKSGSFGLFKIDPKAYITGELSFLIDGHTFPIFTKGNMIEKADDSITLKDMDGSRNGDEILFFRRWQIHVYKLNYLNQKIELYIKKKKSEDRVQIDEAPYKSMLFYDYFRCNYDYGANLKITKDEFEEVYLRKLPQPHDSSIWSKLVTKMELYDPNLIYVSVGIVASFLLVAYMLFFIFLIIYFSSRPKADLDEQSSLLENMLANRARQEQEESLTKSYKTGQAPKKSDGPERSARAEKQAKLFDKPARQYKQLPKLVRPSQSLKSVDTVASEDVSSPARTPKQFRFARQASRSPLERPTTSRSPVPVYSSVPAFSDYMDATASEPEREPKKEKSEIKRFRRH